MDIVVMFSHFTVTLVSCIDVGTSSFVHKPEIRLDYIYELLH